MVAVGIRGRSSMPVAPPTSRADAPLGAALESAPERAAASPRGRRPWPAGLWEPHRPPPSPAQLCVRLDAGCRVPAGSPTGWRPRARPPPYGPRREPGRRTASCRSRRAAGRRRRRSQGRPSRTHRRPRVARTAARSAAPKSRHPVDRRAARATRATTPAPPAVLRWQTHRPPPAGAGSVVNRCGGGWERRGRRAVRPRKSQTINPLDGRLASCRAGSHPLRNGVLHGTPPRPGR